MAYSERNSTKAELEHAVAEGALLTLKGCCTSAQRVAFHDRHSSALQCSAIHASHIIAQMLRSAPFSIRGSQSYSLSGSAFMFLSACSREQQQLTLLRSATATAPQYKPVA